MKKTGDFSVCKLEADSFLETAMWCSENVDNFLCGQMYPFAVNISLSCELYLKAIMIQSSSNCEFESGHDLKCLLIIYPMISKKQLPRFIVKNVQNVWKNC